MIKPKTLLLFALALAVATALIGTGTASADIVCTKNETPCNNVITKLEASINANAKFTDTNGNLIAECQGSKLIWNIESHESGKAASGKLSSLTWAGCTIGGTGVTVTTETLGKLFVKNKTGTTNGTLEDEATVLTINLPLYGDCFYSLGTTSFGTFLSGGNPTLSVNAVINKSKAMPEACPGSLKFSADYAITNHKEAYVHTN